MFRDISWTFQEIYRFQEKKCLDNLFSSSEFRTFWNSSNSINSPGQTDVTNCVTTLLFWLFWWHSLISLPTRNGMLSIESQCIFFYSYPKLAHTIFLSRYNAHMFALLISKVTRKMMSLYLAKNRKLKIFLVQIKWNSWVLSPFPVPRVGYKRSDGLAPTK